MRKLVVAFVVVLLLAAVLRRLVAQQAPAPGPAVKAAEKFTVKRAGDVVKAVAAPELAASVQAGDKRCPRRC